MTMEAVEEPPVTTASGEGVKDNGDNEVIVNAEASVEMDVCHTPNGVADTNDVVDELKNQEENAPVVETTVAEDEQESATNEGKDYEAGNEAMETEVSSAQEDLPVCGNENTDSEMPSEIQEVESSEVETVDGNVIIETEVVEESVVELDGIVDNSGGNITFETEIFIEDNASELEDETVTNEPDSSNILSELGQNIEFSDVLHSSHVSETVENNNCDQEVFNKEELLDILEGNDVEQSRKMISENFHADSHKLEEHLAMQQLSRLKSHDSKKNKRFSPKKPEKKQPKRNSTNLISKETKPKADETSTSTISSKEAKAKGDGEPTNSKATSKEAKSKADEVTNSKSVSKGAKVKTDTAGSSNVIKLDETDGSKQAKETKVKVEATVSSNNTPKGGKEKTGEVDTSDVAPKDPKTKPENSSKVVKPIKTNDKSKKESIVKALVQDWSDDENMEPDESNTLINDSEALLDSTAELVKSQESIQEDSTVDECQADDSTANNADGNLDHNADVSVPDEATLNNTASDETQPQRRLGRVIKKKVIYDPDNPDTFTKSKVKKEKETLPEKDSSVSTPKKLKTEQPQTPKTKSPLSKMQWKKPQPKNSKQSAKRLTEIDRLLMDEGAVNMICQLTPEALKGNKNMKSRAEFIKNIQSNTPDSKEMKFRERKNKIKSEGDPKKLGSDKQRLSLSSSVKSPAVSEDFENHSADDSIIYRRHSSSSYSSSCMSPRRLSDVEGPANQVRESQVPHRESQVPRDSQVPQREIQDVSVTRNSHNSEIFMDEKTSTPKKDIMNKSDCLSIKEKLNSKLSRALNKRKLSGFKSEKPSKLKKASPEKITVNTDVTVNFTQKVAEICIHKSGFLFTIQIMKELENILTLVDSNNDIAVTLITSESGTICSGLYLKPLLEDGKHAHEIAEQARSLMHTMENHSKLLIVGVEGKTQGFSLALASLSDVLISSENASFAFSDRSSASLLNPGAAVLTSSPLPQNLIKDLIVFGKELSASEALQEGLVSRVIWPERFQDQVRAIAADIAVQPNENILLRKQLLRLKKPGCASTFQSSLEKERDLLVRYWTSAGGMQLLRNLDVA